MTVRATILLAALVLLGACREAPDLPGRWTVTDDGGDTATFVFRENGTGVIVKGAQAYRFRYKLNRWKDPMWLDIVFTNPEGEEGRMPGIVEVLDQDILRFRGITEEGQERPTDFNLTPDGMQPGLVMRRQPRPHDE
jgi:hypothetical protein